MLKSRCVICHEADIITSQKLSLTGWTNSVNKMVRWGSQITPQEREVLLPYLAAHFAPLAKATGDRRRRRHRIRTPTRVWPSTSARVSVCHDGDIIEQQKLSKTGWTRSVEKMMRWGATIADADKEPLIEYLASRFPPR